MVNLKMRYSIETRHWIYVKGHEFSSVANNIAKNLKKKQNSQSNWWFKC